MRYKRDELEGKTFGEYTVIQYMGNKNFYSAPMYLVRCSCGTEKVIQGKHLRNGASRSCGCKRTAYRLETMRKRRESE